MSAANEKVQQLPNGVEGAAQPSTSRWRWYVAAALFIAVAVWYFLDGRCRSWLGPLGSTPRDCKGRCGGKAVKDCKGTCGGKAGPANAEGCCGDLKKDCAQMCGGTATLDCNDECGGTAVLDCEGMCNGTAVLDCEGTCGGTAGPLNADGCCGTLARDCWYVCGGTGRCPSSVFLNDTWNNGTKSLSGTYVESGTYNNRPVYKRSDPSPLYIFYAQGIMGDTSRSEYWVIQEKVEDRLGYINNINKMATPTWQTKKEQNLDRVEFEFHNGSGLVEPDAMRFEYT